MDSTFTVSTEKRQKQLLEDKEIQPSESLLALCGYQGPRENMTFYSWQELQAMATCVVEHGSPIKSVRSLNKPSFVEKAQN